MFSRKLFLPGADITIFNLSDTFDCGQCFRWDKLSDTSYRGVVFGRYIVLNFCKGNDFIEILSNEEISDDFIEKFENYFDFSTNYVDKINKLKEKNDTILNNAADCGAGIRLLRQEPFETLISFIISANNNIPRIKKCIESLCRIYGEKIYEEGGEEFYSFPTPDSLAVADPLEIQERCRVGYRADYIVKSAQKYLEKPIDVDFLANADIKNAFSEIESFPGVGPKVANCILLFGGIRRDAFPVDVWVERMVIQLYDKTDMSRNEIEKWGREYFGEDSGLCQQYLFNYIRNHC